MLGGDIPMKIEVTGITDSLIHCGPWTFCRHTGAEVDEYLDWGPPPLWTGSFIRLTSVLRVVAKETV
jgi:hypothetical protein